MRASSNSSAVPASAARSWNALVASAVAGLVVLLLAVAPAPAADDVVEWELAAFPEPSGLAFHPSRNSLFVVGDRGDLGEVSLDGRLLRHVAFGGDLEGIAVDPRSGLLYVAREGHEVIFELAPDDLRILRRFTIDRAFEGNPNFLRRGGDGIEGLAFVPDDADPEGGRFWVVNQFDPAVMVELRVPMRSGKGRFLDATIVRAVAVSPAPLSEVTWRPADRHFLVLSALWKRVVVLDAVGRQLASVHVPGFMPEGLAALPDGRFVIAQDSGGLLVWSPAGDPFAVADGAAGSAKAVGEAPAEAAVRGASGATRATPAEAPSAPAPSGAGAGEAPQ